MQYVNLIGRLEELLGKGRNGRKENNNNKVKALMK